PGSSTPNATAKPVVLRLPLDETAGVSASKSMKTRPSKKRTLLATMTMEPFQPVRLYYRIPSRSAVIGKLRGLECMAENPGVRCWEWLYHGETKPLRFALAGYDDVPKERQPI